MTLMWSLGTNAQTTFTSAATGNWNDGATWGNTSPGVQGTDWPANTDHAVIQNTHTVTLTAAATIVDLDIQDGGILDAATSEMTCNGNFTINGEYRNDAGSGQNLKLEGISTIIDGTASGAINLNNGSSSLTISGNKTIATNAVITVNGNVLLLALGLAADVTNNGSITSSGNINGLGSPTPTWTNSTDSYVSVEGQMMSSANLVATATGNTVEYVATSNFPIKSTVGMTYFNLTISGANTLTVNNDLDVNGDLNISSGTLNANNNDLTIAGNFTINGNFTEGTGTITLDGTGDQSFSAPTDNTLNNLTLSKASGTVNGSTDFTVLGILNLGDDPINMAANTLTLGDATDGGTLSVTSGRIIGAFERFINALPGGAVTFPIGTSSNDRTVTLTINTFTSGGSVTASFVESSPGNAGLSLTDGAVTVETTFPDGYWDLTAANGFAITNYDLDLNGGGFNNAPAPSVDADTRLLIRANAGSNWVVEGTHVNASGTTASRTGLTTFAAQYAFGDDTPCTPPVTAGITGSTSVCTSSQEIYSVSGTPTVGNTFTWVVVGGTINGGVDTGVDLTSITVDWGSTGQAGSVSVTESAPAGCSGTQVTLDVTINTIAPTAITGPTTTFEGETETYSVTSMAGYTYSWTITNGTLSSGDGTNSVEVLWDQITNESTVNVTGVVSVVAEFGACADAAPFATNVTVSNTIRAISDGLWTTPSTWLGGNVPTGTDNAIIPATFDVTTNAVTSVNDLTIETNGTLEIDGNFTVNGNLQVDGALTDALASSSITLSGSETSPQNTLSGTGSITFSATGIIQITNESKQIPSGSSLTITGPTIGGLLTLGASITVTNLGSTTVNGNISGQASSTWINGANSSLTIDGTLLSTGSLSAGATGNTVSFTGSDNFTIKQPTDSYNDITFAGTGIASLGANLTVDGDLNLQSGTLAATPSNFRIILRGDWNNTGGTFNEQQGTLQIDGTGDQLIINTAGEETFHFVEVNKASGTLTVQNGTTMRIAGATGGPAPGHGVMTFTNGIVNTSATGLLIFNDGSSTTGATAASFVDGPVRKVGNTAFEFPIGDGSIWAPLSLSDFQGAAVTDEVTVEYFDQPFSNTTSFGASGLNNVSLVEYWDVSATGGFTVDLTFFWKDINRSSIDDANDLRIAHWNGTSWDDLGKLAVPTLGTEGSVTADNVGSFSPFTFGSSSSSSNPLPVDLLSFEANLVEDQTELTWSTASEINNDFFLVQRSEDGTEWETLGEVDGNGTVNEIINYGFRDTRPLFGKSFYRLKQVDFDGQFEYSPVVSVNNPFTGQAMRVMVYPNPTSAENINLRVLTGNQENKISIQLIDALGHRFIDEKMSPETFSQDVIVRPNEGLSKGVYFLMVSQNNNVVKQRLIVD